jgi:hypothetical protein
VGETGWVRRDSIALMDFDGLLETDEISNKH